MKRIQTMSSLSHSQIFPTGVIAVTLMLFQMIFWIMINLAARTAFMIRSSEASSEPN